MTFYKPRLGLRTLKTGLAVFIVVFSFTLLNREGSFVASLAAVFALRQDFEKTKKFAFIRTISNIAGGIFALIDFYLIVFFGEFKFTQSFAVPILLILLIIILDSFSLNAGIIGACAAFLTITLTFDTSTTVIYVLNRILDTFIGVLIALIINRFGHKHNPHVTGHLEDLSH